ACLLFKKNTSYYVGVVNGSSLDEKIVAELLRDITPENRGEKMRYHVQKPDHRNVPRLFIRSKGSIYAPAVKKYNLPIETIIDIYDKGLFKTENKEQPFYKESLTKVIDYFKLGFSKHESYKDFTFRWKESSSYDDISQFYEDTMRSCYDVSWMPINFDKLFSLVAKGDLFLFRICNKDFDAKNGGRKNLHTIYFETLFSPANRDEVVVKLNGGG